MDVIDRCVALVCSGLSVVWLFGVVWWVGWWCLGLLVAVAFFGVWWLVVGLLDIDGEFDPGSGRTLAACLTHASRTVICQLAGGDQWRTGE